MILTVAVRSRLLYEIEKAIGESHYDGYYGRWSQSYHMHEHYLHLIRALHHKELTPKSLYHLRVTDGWVDADETDTSNMEQYGLVEDNLPDVRRAIYECWVAVVESMRMFDVYERNDDELILPIMAVMDAYHSVFPDSKPVTNLQAKLRAGAYIPFKSGKNIFAQYFRTNPVHYHKTLDAHSRSQYALMAAFFCIPNH